MNVKLRTSSYYHPPIDWNFTIVIGFSRIDTPIGTEHDIHYYTDSSEFFKELKVMLHILDCNTTIDLTTKNLKFATKTSSRVFRKFIGKGNMFEYLTIGCNEYSGVPPKINLIINNNTYATLTKMMIPYRF